jgi:hypothetical protein
VVKDAPGAKWAKVIVGVNLRGRRRSGPVVATTAARTTFPPSARSRSGDRAAGKEPGHAADKQSREGAYCEGRPAISTRECSHGGDDREQRLCHDDPRVFAAVLFAVSENVYVRMSTRRSLRETRRLNGCCGSSTRSMFDGRLMPQGASSHP